MDFLISPMVNALLFFYSVFGNSFVMAIIVMTILVRLITLPLTLPQQRSTRKMQALAPQLEEIKKKYGNDRNKLAQAQMQLYKENNVSMFGGCLPLILQLVIMIAFYQAITGALAINPLQLLSLSHRVAPGLGPLIPISSKFAIFDLGLPETQPVVNLILPVLVVATTWLSQKLMTPPSADPSASAMTKQMNVMMPLMFGFFALNFATGLSIYFIVSNLIGAAQALAMNRYWQPTLATTGVTTKASKPAKAIAAPKEKKK